MIYLLPFIAALIGWLTNYIAVKMLFHPKEKVRILFFDIQGVFPKRKHKLAEKLGKVVANELFSIDDIRHALAGDETQTEIRQVVSEKLDVFMNEKLPEAMPMLKMFMNEEVAQNVKAILLEQFDEAIPDILNNYISKIEKDVDVEKTVYDKVINFSSDKLEEILYSIMQKEFRFIEILGGVLGFIIGLVQLLLISL